jgi:hypothetical protein
MHEAGVTGVPGTAPVPILPGGSSSTLYTT